MPFAKPVLGLAALGLLLAADLVNLMAQAGQADGTLFGMPWQPSFITLLLETRIGALAIARAGLAFLLAGLLLPRPNRWNRWVGLAGGLLLLGGVAMVVAGKRRKVNI